MRQEAEGLVEVVDPLGGKALAAGRAPGLLLAPLQARHFRDHRQFCFTVPIEGAMRTRGFAGRDSEGRVEVII